jgi:hypothetical protein
VLSTLVGWSCNTAHYSTLALRTKSKPSWYLVATEDKMIPPRAQRSINGASWHREALLSISRLASADGEAVFHLTNARR